MSAQTYPPRPWIAAADSYAAQGQILRDLPDSLASQLRDIPRHSDRIAILGIGASLAAAASGVHRMHGHGIDATRHNPIELAQGAGPLAGALVIAASQSGASAEVVSGAKQFPSDRLLSITNYAPSPLADYAGMRLNLGDHPDSSVSMPTFTATILAFGMLADHLAGTLDTVYWHDVVNGSVAAAQAAIAEIPNAPDALSRVPYVDVVAPAPLLGAAEEAALMLREGPRVAATAMETRQYLHGPMDVAGRGAHVVIGGARESLLVEQLSAKTEALVFIATDADVPAPRAEIAARTHLDVPYGDAVGIAIAASIVCQHLTLGVASLRGVDVDEPAFERLDTKTHHGSAGGHLGVGGS